MTESGLGVPVDVGLELVPIPIVVADLLAIGTDRQQPSQHTDLIQLATMHVQELEMGMDPGELRVGVLRGARLRPQRRR